jgi:hypothetical protein
VHSEIGPLPSIRCMKKLVAACTLIIIASCGYSQPTQQKTFVDVYTMWSVDDLRWSIAGNLNGQNPDIYSELIWKDLRSGGVGLDANRLLWKSLWGTVDVEYSWIYAGKVTDSDYAGDGRTQRTFYASLRSDKGYLYAVSPALGWKFRFDGLTILPNLGYAISQQKLYLLDDIDLNSSYQTFWRGPFGSVVSSLKITEVVFLEGFVRYEQLRYTAEADWNLVETFQHPVSFRHRANAFGFSGRVAVGCNLSNTLALFIRGEYGHYSSGNGIDQLYLSDGSSMKTMFNGVVRDQWQCQVGLRFRQ